MVETWYTGKGATKKYQPVDKKGHPIKDAEGKPVYKTEPGGRSGQLTYQQAYRRLRAYNLSDSQSRTLLNTRYKRGERQRPWVDAPQRDVLRKARVKPTATYFQGRRDAPFLNAAQVQALQAAHILPPGELVNGRYFIAPGY